MSGNFPDISIIFRGNFLENPRICPEIPWNPTLFGRVCIFNALPAEIVELPVKNFQRRLQVTTLKLAHGGCDRWQRFLEDGLSTRSVRDFQRCFMPWMSHSSMPRMPMVQRQCHNASATMQMKMGNYHGVAATVVIQQFRYSNVDSAMEIQQWRYSNGDTAMELQLWSYSNGGVTAMEIRVWFDGRFFCGRLLLAHGINAAAFSFD